MNFVLPLISLIIGYLIGSIPFGYIIGKFHGIDITKEGSGSTGTTNALRLLGKKAAILVLLGDFLKGFIAPYLGLFICYFTINLFLIISIYKYSFLKAFSSILYFFTIKNLLGIITISIMKIHMASFRSPFDSYLFPITEVLHIIIVSACIGALIGHVKSCWIGFKGGKAVATGVGTLFALDWRVGLITAIIWALTVYISKYSSLGALIAVPLSPIFMYYFKLGNEGKWIYVAYCVLGAAYIIYKHQANIKRLLNGTEPQVGQKKAEAETEIVKT